MDLKPDESKRIVCPFCNGGSSAEKSFNIKRVAFGLLYNCFRASCPKGRGILGDIRGSVPVWEETGTSKVSSIRQFKGVLTELPYGIYKERYAPYEVSFETVQAQGIRYAPEINRIYVPFFDHRGYQFAEDLRAVDKMAKPKALINPWTGSLPLIHFPLGMDPSSKVLIVEDYLSAIKCSSICYCASITGTHLSDEGIRHFLEIGIKEVKIMLDGDAVQQALKLQRRLMPFFSTSIIPISNTEDPKDVPYKYLKEILNG